MTGEIKEKLLRVFNMTEQDSFDVYLRKSLKELLDKEDESVIDSLEELIAEKKIDSDVTWAVLQVLGDVDHDYTYDNRQQLLVDCLRHTSAFVRDGAGLGLSLMNDWSVSNDISDAIERETNSELKKDLQQVLEELPRPEEMYDPPDTIYLQVLDHEFNEPVDEVTWCEDSMNRWDIEYVRVDSLEKKENLLKE